MYVVTRRYEKIRIDEAARRAEKGVGDILKSTPGFRGYYVVDGGDGVGLSVSLFDSREAAVAASDKAMAWIRENLSDIYEGEPQVTAGEALVSLAG